MKIKEQAIKELETLKPSDVLIVYDLMQSLKSKEIIRKPVKPLKAYLRVREALKRCKGSMSDDILMAREDRI